MKRILRPLVIGNWKMNPQTLSAAIRLAKEVKSALARKGGADVVLAPPALYIDALQSVRSGSKLFSVGAQNVHPERLGAYTGEISISMLSDLKVSHVIIGHSERREMGEKNDIINKKVRSALREGLVPVVCIGERERDHSGRYLGFIERQIREACAGVPKGKIERLVIAYEPIWAIGTGDTAGTADVHEMKIFIQKVLTDLYGRSAAHKVRILYGGSVTAKNAAMLMREGMADGFLVGGASLRASEFAAIVAESSSL